VIDMRAPTMAKREAEQRREEAREEELSRRALHELAE